MSDKLNAERLRALDDLDNRAETLSDRVLSGQDVRQYLYDHRAAILAMVEERERDHAEIAKLRGQIAGMKIELYGVPAPEGAKAISIHELHKPRALGKDQA